MKKSHIIAIVFTGAIVIWMAMGIISKDLNVDIKSAKKNPVLTSQKTVVEIKKQTVKPIVSYILTHGDVTPNREANLRAETSGKVSKIFLEEGAVVKTGDVILNLDMNDREIKLEQTKSKTVEEKQKYKTAKNLAKKGYASKTKVNEAFAALKTAQASEEKIALDIENTNIKAPFEGIIDTQNIEVGDYLNIGDKILTIVDNKKLIVNTYIPQQEILNVKTGNAAEVALITGQKETGVISFISPRAERATRTFRVEIEVPNPNKLPSGTSATVRIPKQSIMAHFISPALLTLDKKGVMGVKIVNEKNIVEFYPVKIIKSEIDGLYITGLPSTVKIITAGQGFVSVGEKVSTGAPNANN